MHSIKVVHFGHQCPWINFAKEQARRAAAMSGAAYSEIDATVDEEVAAKHGLFFPFVTIVDEMLSFGAPIRAEEIMRLSGSTPGHEMAQQAPDRPEAPAAHVRPFNASDATPWLLCSGQITRDAKDTTEWLQATMGGDATTRGFVSERERTAEGFIAFLPSVGIPFLLPASKKILPLSPVYTLLRTRPTREGS